MSSMDVTRSCYCITAVAGTCMDGVLCPWLDLPMGGLAMVHPYTFQHPGPGPLIPGPGFHLSRRWPTLGSATEVAEKARERPVRGGIRAPTFSRGQASPALSPPAPEVAPSLAKWAA